VSVRYTCRHGRSRAVEDDRFVGAVSEKSNGTFRVTQSLRVVARGASGGADSAYLAWAANRVLGSARCNHGAFAELFRVRSRTRRRIFRAVSMPHEFIETHELENPAYQANRPDRCYHCKNELFSVLTSWRRNGASRRLHTA